MRTSNGGKRASITSTMIQIVAYTGDPMYIQSKPTPKSTPGIAMGVLAKNSVTADNLSRARTFADATANEISSSSTVLTTVMTMLCCTEPITSGSPSRMLNPPNDGRIDAKSPLKDVYKRQA